MTLIVTCRDASGLPDTLTEGRQYEAIDGFHLDHAVYNWFIRVVGDDGRSISVYARRFREWKLVKDALEGVEA